ncbi:ABC transporter permease/M1 family aminopeptidase [candidate division CSSED10-310 bacterium]|uniref:ABC transporter permease/M1 family aminopeptidase n=1 Tax=candidate division CSSED10-310 bacterium TaxID=2855610 RepID=A0ABV6YRN8_UNCC1
MILKICEFELKNRLSRLSTYVYFLTFFGIAFLAFLAAGGAFKSVTVGFGTSRKALVNSPQILFSLISFISYFGILVISAIQSQTVYQDFHHKSYPLFYTTPITTRQYLSGRFLGGFLVLIFIFTSLGLGAWLASVSPFVERSFFGPQMLMAYIHPYFISVIPNIFFIGAIFFTTAALSRKIFPVYIGSVVLLIGYLIAIPFAEDLDNKIISAVLDPFGLFAVDQVTEYWTVVEQNTRLVPLEGALLVNRLVWVGIGILCLILAYFRFSFTEKARAGQPGVVHDVDHMAVTPREDKIEKTPFQQDFQPAAHLKIFGRLTRLEFRETLKNVYFIAILLCGVLFMFSQSWNLGQFYGTETYPVTYKTLDLIGGSFALFVIIIITIYAGELVWRERDHSMNQLFDVLPIPNWVTFTSKLLALLLVQVFLWLTVLVSCLLIQIFSGYFNFELGLYFKDLFGIKYIQFALISVLAVFIQVIVNNKFLGHFIMVLYYILSINMAVFGYDHNLYNFGGSPGTPYSDMNNFGHFIRPFIWFNVYWSVFAVMLALLSNLFWVRGVETHVKWRWHLARQRFSRSYRIAMAVCTAGFFILGGYIYYNTNILNTYETKKYQELEQVRYEQTYQKYKDYLQPRITDVVLEVDIFPAARDVFFRGRYKLLNKSTQEITTLIVNLVAELDIRTMSFNRPTQVQLSDKKLGFYIYELSEPLRSQETIELEFDLAYVTRGFKNSGSVRELVYNGTFINSGMLPSLGYQEQAEIADDRTRKKYGLPPKPRTPDINDQKARMNTYITTDADWVTFEATLSTSPDQIAIAPGYLQREWMENKRRYFHYKMDSKILNFFSFMSARYKLKKDSWHDVNIEIYYQPGHEYNLERMIKAIKKSLEYYSVQFSPYQHRQVRIIEFPRYSFFAQSFPNTIPYSESIGFIAKVDENDPDEIDYPFYVTAHEVAHQWWAHQVIGANVQGSTLMSEALAQYSALMVMEKEFGPHKMRKFLKFELDSYLRGRSSESKSELPLYLNENQPYIHYNKGSVVMYALKDYIGEETLNKALARYIEDKAFQEPPYTTSLEFLEYIKDATPDELLYVVEDMFETITLYDNRTIKASCVKLADDKYETKLTLKAKKIRADETGKESDVALNDWIDIGIFGDSDTVLYLQKHKIEKEDLELTIQVEAKPVKAGIDPYNKLIDRKSDDNSVDVKMS